MYLTLLPVHRFLDEVQTHCNENKMSVQNLATVFGPNILRPKMEDPVAIMEGTGNIHCRVPGNSTEKDANKIWIY